MPTRGHEGHDMGKPEGVEAHPSPKIDDNHPGYEIQDVSIGGVWTFMAALIGSVMVFFVFCFFMGKAINYALVKQDGEPNRWQGNLQHPGETPRGEKRAELMSSPVMQQHVAAALAQNFPTPRLETDDGDQDIADLHAREDLLLDYYSKDSNGTVRIPVAKAMELILQRGLGASSAAPSSATTASASGAAASATTATAATKPMFGDDTPEVTAPLTDGFARTSYELDTIEARNQKNAYEKAEKGEK
ncbi:MAG: hypothetical protein ABI064_02835 [Acidobacteriaceae bacterium]